MAESTPAVDPATRLQTVSLYLVWAGAATVSFDVVGIDVAGRTLKVNMVLFGLAIALAFARSARAAELRRPRGVEWRRPTASDFVLIFATALLSWMFVRALFTGDLRGSLGGFAALAIPAGMPFLAIRLHRRWISSIVRAFVWGMCLAAVIALVEFIVRSRGWTWLTDYDGTYDGRPRSAAFAFEAAYLAAPLVAALLILVVTWQPGWKRTGAGVVMSLGIAVTIARIVVVQISVAVIALLLLAAWLGPAERRRILRGLSISIVVLAAATLPLVALRPATVESALDRIGSIFDPDEEASNSPRLEEFERVSTIISDHPIVGIGPGMLGDEFRARGFNDDPDRPDASFVTNNVWTQSLIDGGAVALLLQTALTVSALATIRRRSRLDDAVVTVAWATVIIGAGLTVSNFWDAEPWLLLAAVVAVGTERETEPA